MSGGLQDDLQGRCVSDALSSPVDCRLRRPVRYGNNKCGGFTCNYIAPRGKLLAFLFPRERVDVVGRVICLVRGRATTRACVSAQRKLNVQL